MNRPALLLADEPTGALDSRSTQDVLALFDQLNEAGRTLVVVTHEDEVAARAKRAVRLTDGVVVEDLRVAPVDGPPPGIPAPTAGTAP
jgi:putative ABC transport system ATP-binding protein